MTSITCPSTSSSRRATRMSANLGKHPGARTYGCSTRLAHARRPRGRIRVVWARVVRGTELKAVLGMVLALVAGLAVVAGSAPPVTAQEWPAAQGCKVSYWKQRANLESWGATGYSPSDKIRGRLRPQDLRQDDVAAGHEAGRRLKGQGPWSGDCCRSAQLRFAWHLVRNANRERVPDVARRGHNLLQKRPQGRSNQQMALPLQSR